MLVLADTIHIWPHYIPVGLGTCDAQGAGLSLWDICCYISSLSLATFPPFGRIELHDSEADDMKPTYSNGAAPLTTEDQP
jgi:hypothetical protein